MGTCHTTLRNTQKLAVPGAKYPLLGGVVNELRTTYENLCKALESFREASLDYQWYMEELEEFLRAWHHFNQAFKSFLDLEDKKNECG